MLCLVGEVVLSALLARLLMDDTQAYICMDCKEGNNLALAPEVGGIEPRKKIEGLWPKTL